MKTWCSYWGWGKAGRFALSPPFKAAVQYTVGMLITGIFVFVRPISFPYACISALLLVVNLSVLSPDNHIGTRLLGAATLTGAMAWALVLGGIFLSLARQVLPSSCATPVGCTAHTALLCGLGVVVLAVLVLNRAALGPPYAGHIWVAGMVSVLAFGLVIIAGQFHTDLRRMWHDVVGGLMLSNLVAGGLAAVVSLAVLPSLAADEMRGDAAAAIRGLGHAASRFASRGLEPDDAVRHPRHGHGPNNHRLNRHGKPLPPPGAFTAGRKPPSTMARLEPSRASSPLPRSPKYSTSTWRDHSLSQSGDQPQQHHHFQQQLSPLPPSQQPRQQLQTEVEGVTRVRQGSEMGCGTASGSASLPAPAPAPAASVDSAAAPAALGASGAAADVWLPPAAGGARSPASLECWDCAVSARAVAAVAVASTVGNGGHGSGSGGRLHVSPPASPSFSRSYSRSYSCYSSDEEDAFDMQLPRGGGSDVDANAFEHVMEDEDAFLLMLQEATAPQQLPPPRGSRGRKGTKRGLGHAAASLSSAPAPLPAVAPPGGILPSPSTRDLNGLTAAPASVNLWLSAGSASKFGGSSLTRTRPEERGHDKSPTAAVWAVAADGSGGLEAAMDVSGGGPATAHAGGDLGGAAVAWAPVSALRPLLARARACAAAAAVEPPCMIRGPADVGAWSRLLCCCEVLLNRVAALECLLEDHRPGQAGHALGDPSLAALLGCDVVAPYRRVYGEVAASCAAMSEAMAESCRGRPGPARWHRWPFAAVGGWEATRQCLRALNRDVLSSYWARVRAGRAAAAAAAAAAGSQSGEGGAEVGAGSPRGGEGPTAAATVAGAGVGGGGAASNEPGGPEVDLHAKSRHRNHRNHQHHVHLDHDAQQQQHSSRHVIHLHHHIHLLHHHRHHGRRNSFTLASSHQHQHYHHQQHLHRQQQHAHNRHRRSKIRTISLHQARAITFLWTVTEGVISAMEGMEAAAQQALGDAREPKACASNHIASRIAFTTVNDRAGTVGTPVAAASSEPGPCAAKAAPEAGSSCSDSSSSARGGDEINSASAGVDAGEGRAVLNDGAVASPRADPQPAAPLDLGRRSMLREAASSQQLQQQQHWFRCWPVPCWSTPGSLIGVCCGLAWAAPLFNLTLGLPMVQNLPVVLATNVRQLSAGGAAARSALLSSRNFQFGLKYWLASCGVLCLILGLAARPDMPIMRQYPMLYAFIATVVSMTDRVESTFSRAMLRAFGTCAGGLVGLAMMEWAQLRHSAVGIMVVLCAVTFMTGCMASNKLMYGFVLALLTLQSIVLCQYGTHCCHSPGSTLEMFAARVVSVLLGCTLPVLFSQVILPWYTSDWALETMAAACTASAALVRQLYGMYFDEHLRAHVSSHGTAATCDLMWRYGLEAEAEAAGLLKLPLSGSDQPRDGDQAQGQQRGEKAGGGDGRTAAADATAVGTTLAAAAQPTTDAELADALKTRVSGPLVAVQASLMKDVAVWTRGIYATPPIVPAVLRCCLLLADRLAALQLVVADIPPPVYGMLSGWAFKHMVLPLHGETKAVLDALDRVAATTAALLDPAGRGGAGISGTTATPASDTLDATSAKGKDRIQFNGDEELGGAVVVGDGGGNHGDYHVGHDGTEELREAVCDLDMRRLQLRQHIHDMRQAFHASIRTVEEQDLSYATHPDDTVRVNSMLYALVKVLDKATATARTVAEFTRAGTGPARRPAAGALRAPWTLG